MSTHYPFMTIKTLSTIREIEGACMSPDLPLDTTMEVKDRCLCLHLQRAARIVARLFDEAFRPFGITNGQFSLLMALNRPEAPRLKDLAPLLGMDRTTLTANLKPLERKGFLMIARDDRDRRARRLKLTQEGQALLIELVPIWRAKHDELDQMLAEGRPELLRADLQSLSFSSEP